MAATLIENALLLRPAHSVRPGSVLLNEGKIAAIDPQPMQDGDSWERVDAQGALLTPGLIDLHCHGVEHCLFERDPAEIIEASLALPRYGTTCILPTLYSVLNRKSLALIERLADALPLASGCATPGFHMEGPFLALTGAGGETVPGDLGLLKELLAAARGRVLAMSVSPDAPQVLPIIEHLCDLQIAVFMTHTRASVNETQAAIDAGARHATHFYDVFPVPHETDAGVRPVGAVETILADARCSVDFICDGVHVHPMAIKAALAAKGPSKVVAITDSNVGAGLGEGVYDTPWGYPIEVRQRDAARVADKQHPKYGFLAGSALTMDRAMANLVEWLDLPLEQIWAMGTANPAAVAGLGSKGVLREGADADLVLWRQYSDGWRAEMTWVAGQCVYDRGLSPVS
jgi:N-acetylglucosamine-6-phosphate deacetylase